MMFSSLIVVLMAELPCFSTKSHWNQVSHALSCVIYFSNRTDSMGPDNLSRDGHVGTLGNPRGTLLFTLHCSTLITQPLPCWCRSLAGKLGSLSACSPFLFFCPELYSRSTAFISEWNIVGEYCISLCKCFPSRTSGLPESITHRLHGFFFFSRSRGLIIFRGLTGSMRLNSSVL